MIKRDINNDNDHRDHISVDIGMDIAINGG